MESVIKICKTLTIDTMIKLKSQGIDNNSSDSHLSPSNENSEEFESKEDYSEHES